MVYFMEHRASKFVSLQQACLLPVTEDLNFLMPGFLSSKAIYCVSMCHPALFQVTEGNSDSGNWCKNAGISATLWL
jgi:hypothetical protein